jgi:hypothetical protein
MKIIVSSLLLALYAGGCAAFMSDLQKADSAIIAVEPQVAADLACVVQALASDPNILNPVDDLLLVPSIVVCFTLPDGGSSVSADAKVALVSRHRATAAAIATKRKAAVAK